MAKKKKLGLIDLIALSAGQVIGAGIVTLIGSAITLTGVSAWLAFVPAVVIGFLSIFPFVLLSSTIVLKGGDYSVVNMFVKNKQVVGFFALAFVLQCLSISMLGKSFANYLATIIPGVNTTVVACAAVIIFFVLNLMGVNIMAKVQRIMTIVLIAVLVAFCVLGFGSVSPETFNFSSPDFFTNGAGGFMSATALYVYSTYGQYTVINYSKDAENPKRDVPIAMLVATIIILVLYVGIGIVACGVLPLDEVASQPLTIVARVIFGNRWVALFVIGGPLMALATTMNSTYAARVNVLSKAAEDGWWPNILAKKNNRGVPFILLTIIFIFGIVPIIFGVPINTLANNLVLIAYILHTITAVAIIKMPKMFPEEWKASRFHMPNGVFYGVIILACAAQLYMVYISLVDLPLPIAIMNVCFIVGCFIVAHIRYKMGKVVAENEKTIEE